MTGKRRGWTAAALVSMLPGCAGMPSTPPADDIFEVALWANDDSVDSLPNRAASASHPCGAIVVLRLRAMPPHMEPQGPVGTELVAEIDEAGRTLRQWSVPVDYEPLAIRRDELLLDHGGRALWIGTSGAMRRGAPPHEGTGIERLDCPAGAPHADSAYRQCGSLRDLESGARRTLAYESSCT